MENISQKLNPVNLFDLIESRILSGSPFTSARSAWQGGETLFQFGDLTISLIIIGQTLYVRASTPYQYLGSIEVAERLGRGQYRMLIEGPRYQSWLANTTGLIEAPAYEIPAPVDPVDNLAIELKARYALYGRDFSDRLDRAVELFKVGQIDFPEYGTGSSYAQNPPTRICDCPDARFRSFRAEGIGMVCKHTLAQLLADLLNNEARQVTQRKLIDRQDARRAVEQRAARQNALPQWICRPGSIEEALG